MGAVLHSAPVRCGCTDARIYGGSEHISLGAERPGPEKCPVAYSISLEIENIREQYIFVVVVVLRGPGRNVNAKFSSLGTRVHAHPAAG